MEAAYKLVQVAVFKTVRRRMKQGPQEDQEESSADSKQYEPGAQEHSAASDASQERNSPDWQPLGHQDIAVTQENGRMWRDELPWRKFTSRLLSTRTNLSVCDLAIA